MVADISGSTDHKLGHSTRRLPGDQQRRYQTRSTILDRRDLGEEAHFPPMASHAGPMGSSKHRPTRPHQGSQPCHLPRALPLIHHRSTHTDALLMLAADCDILAAPIPDNNLLNPTHLELWAKRTRSIVNRSEADATIAIHHTHEHLTHYFRHRRKKKTATPTDRSTHQLLLNTAHQPNKKDPEGPGLI